jgi:S1-C subfamily serine protease
MASVVACRGQAVNVAPRWQVSYPAAANGRPAESTAVPVSGDSDLVAVVLSGADAGKPKIRVGNREVPARMIGHDPVSRLGFYKVEGGMAPKATPWLESAGGADGMNLRALAPDGPVKCRTNGWVKQVGGKILPLALLRVNFEKPVPPSGTPLVDDGGRVAGIVFQAAGGANTGYAIPAEAVHRVRRDVYSSGKLVRGWLGLALLAENQAPQIVRVLAGSPAAAAGVMPNDVLLSVGTRRISDYADAANAFFYLIPGEKVKVRVMRGVETREFELTPTRPQAE